MAIGLFVVRATITADREAAFNKLGAAVPNAVIRLVD